MFCSGSKLVNFISKQDTHFIIPVYQRNYDWKEENCKQLFDDLVSTISKASKEGSELLPKNHFFGSIVSVSNQNNSSNETYFTIVDGQQRLTTVSLLLLAIRNLLKDHIVESEKADRQDYIYEVYLTNRWLSDGLPPYKLQPVEKDKVAFDKLFTDPSAAIPDSNLTINYQYFCKRIKKQEITVDELLQAICCLEVIHIQLEAGKEDPQLIFESLNSTGLNLNEADKIRNLILMGLNEKEQNRYYRNYWNIIEGCTKYDVSAFIRDYLSVMQPSIPRKNEIYVKFKEYFRNCGVPTEVLLAEMKAYAKRYQTLLDGNTDSIVLNNCIFRLNWLETTTTRPFFLEVLRLKDEGKLSMAQVEEIFQTTESYLLRRTICDLPTNALNKIFASLHQEIFNYSNNEDDYLEKFKYALLSKNGGSRFPDDEDFADAFAKKEIYRMVKNRVYILERLENFGTREGHNDVYSNNSFSIEHIMPQTLNAAWRKELGKDYEQIHKTWLHRIANLTLTAYNSKYSNNSFSEKKTKENGYEQSHFIMTREIAKKDKWTLTELEERSDILKERALKIWKLPKASFQPKSQKKEQEDWCTLGDDEELTNRSLVRFSFNQTTMNATTWVEMFQKVIQMLYKKDKSIILQLAYSQEQNNSLRFIITKSGSEKPDKSAKIDDGIYVWTNTNTQSKLSALNRLFTLYNEDPNDLVFYLKANNK